MHRLMRGCWLVWRITSLNVRARLEYRTEFLLLVAVGAAWQMSILVFATVLLVRFPGLGGWDSRHVLLMASMRLLSHGLYVLVLGRVTWLPLIVQAGQIEAFMLRPIPVYRQVQLAFFNANAVGDLVVAATLFAVALSIVDIEWAPAGVAYLVVAIIGGFLMEAAIATTISCVALHAPATTYWSNWLDELMTAFGNYPLHILPSAARGLLTFFLPLAFVAYLPAAVLTGNLHTLAVPSWLAIGAPLVGLLAYLGSRQLWALSLRYYKGVGSV